MRFVRLSLLVGAVMLAAPTPARAQTTVEEVSGRFRGNIVRITTRFTRGVTRDGFGFVVRESNDTLFVVTAGHVVIHEDPTQRTERISIGFWRYIGTARAVLLRPDPADLDLDLALLGVPKPSGYRWNFRRATARATRGTRVWIVGRDLTWKATAEDFAGQVSGVRGGELTADFGGAEPGTSGGPLLSRRGIVGLVVNDEGNEVTALTIDQVRRVALTEWMGIEDIDFSDYPLFAITGSAGFASTTRLSYDAARIPPVGFSLSALAMFPSFGVGVDVATGKIKSRSVRDRLLDQRFQFRNSYTRYRGRLHLYTREAASRQHTTAYVFAALLRLEPQLRADEGEWVRPNQVGVSFTFDETAWAFGIGVGLGALSYNNAMVGFDLSFGYTTTSTFSIDITDPFTAPGRNDWLIEVQLSVGYAFRSRASKLRILR